MWTSAKLNDGSLTNYGFGWELGETKGHAFMQHSGSWQGFNSYIRRYPDDRLAVIVLANRSRAQLPTIVQRVSAHYLPDVTLPSPQPLSAKLLRTTPIFMTGTHGDAEIRHRPRRVAPGLFELQQDLDAGWLAFRFTSDDGAISLGAIFDEQSVRLGDAKPVVQDGRYLLLQLKHRTTYVFRLDVREPGSPSIILREVTH